MSNPTCEQCGNALPGEEWMVTVTTQGCFCSHNCLVLFTQDVAVTVDRQNPHDWSGWSHLFGEGPLNRLHEI